MDKIFVRENGSIGQLIMFHDDDNNPLDEILTKQCFVDECDINNIVRKYRKTGALPVPQGTGAYVDFTQIDGFQDAMQKVCEAQEMFDALPATLRYRFNNDPGMFLDFVDNPANKSELIDLGLVVEANVSLKTDNIESPKETVSPT